MRKLILLLFLAIPAFPQSAVLYEGHGIPFQPRGYLPATADPATCIPGVSLDVFRTDLGTRKYCSATNTWTQYGAGSSGTVTSVNVTFPSIFSVTGGPVTGSGTIAATLANQTAGTFFVGGSPPNFTASTSLNPVFNSVVGQPSTDASSLVGRYNSLGQTSPVVEVQTNLNAHVCGLWADAHTDCTVPVATGITGLATGIPTFLATPSSANLLATMTTKTGTGLSVFGTGPTLSGLTLSDVATGTQCLHANSSGVVSGTGSDCGSGGGGSVFTGSTAVTSTFSATPTFSLADLSVKSPTRFEPGALTANVTSVTFTNKTAGAKFTIAWLQDATGGRTISYGASASNTCTISATANKTTIQRFEVAADGTTVVGAGCSSDDPADTPITVLSGDVTTPGSGSGVVTIGAAKVAPAMMKASTFDAQTDGATITWAIGSVLNAQASVTLGGNRTLNITNPVIGGNYVFKITQDGTGTRTLTLGTGCTWKVIGGGSGAITLSTAAGSLDILAFTYDGTNCLANLGKNYN